MPLRTVNLSLNCRKTGFQTVVEGLHVGDVDSCRFSITLIDGLKTIDLSSGAAVMTATKPDGTTIQNDCTIENNKIIYDLTEQDAVKKGYVNYQVVVTVSDGVDSEVMYSAMFRSAVLGNIHVPVYRLLTSETAPENWATEYTKYYQRENNEYVANNDSEYVSGKFYYLVNPEVESINDYQAFYKLYAYLTNTLDEINNAIDSKAESEYVNNALAGKLTIDTTTVTVDYNPDNPKIIYANAIVNGEKGIILTANDSEQTQFFFGRTGTFNIRRRTESDYSGWEPHFEKLSNKSTAITDSNQRSEVYYPSIKAVVNYVSENFIGLSDYEEQIANIEDDLADKVKYESQENNLNNCVHPNTIYKAAIGNVDNPEYALVICANDAGNRRTQYIFTDNGRVLYRQYNGSEWGEFAALIPDISGKEDSTNKVTSITAQSTDSQYPTAKAAYTAINNKADKANTLSGYDITDAYTKTEVDGLINEYAGKELLFPKSVVYNNSVESATNRQLLFFGSVGSGSSNISLDLPNLTSADFGTVFQIEVTFVKANVSKVEFYEFAGAASKGLYKSYESVTDGTTISFNYTMSESDVTTFRMRMFEIPGDGGNKLSVKVSRNMYINEYTYSKGDINNALNGKSNTNHTHDMSAYATNASVNNALAGKSDINHTHSQYLTQQDIESIALTDTLFQNNEEEYAYSKDEVAQQRLIILFGAVGPNSQNVAIGLPAFTRDDIGRRFHIEVTFDLAALGSAQFQITYNNNERSGIVQTVSSSYIPSSGDTISFDYTVPDNLPQDGYATSLRLTMYDTSGLQQIKVNVKEFIKIDKFTYSKGWIEEALSGKSNVEHTHSQYLTQHQDVSGKEDKSNKVTEISAESTDTQYPSAKAVYSADFRKQDKPVESIIVTTWTSKKAISLNGDIVNIPESSYKVSNPIPVTEGDRIHLNTKIKLRYSFYLFTDNNENKISCEPSTNYTPIATNTYLFDDFIVVPANAKFLYIATYGPNNNPLYKCIDYSLDLEPKFVDLDCVRVENWYLDISGLPIEFTSTDNEQNKGGTILIANVNGGETIKLYGRPYRTNYYVSFFSENIEFDSTKPNGGFSGSTLISGLTGTNTTENERFTKILTVPDGAKTVVISGFLCFPLVYKKSGYQQKRKWVGKKWCVVGDSLTEKNKKATKNYADYISESTGIEVTNMGWSGSGYKKRDDETPGKAFYQRITGVDGDCDVVTVMGGYNDRTFIAEYLGTANDTGTNTLGGCINTMIDNLYSVLPTVQLGIISPVPVGDYNPYDSTSEKANLFVALLEEICKKRSIPFLNLYYESNLRPWDPNFRDLVFTREETDSETGHIIRGAHPDENAHKLFAPRIEAFLDTLLLH